MTERRPVLNLPTETGNPRKGLREALWGLLLRKPVFVPILAGGIVALAVLIAEAHGPNERWWLHGAVIALVTGLLMGLFARWHIREVKRYEARLRAAEQMSHDVGNALVILMHRDFLPAEQRVHLEDEAIERIRSAMREILPEALDIAMKERPISNPHASGTKGDQKIDGCA